MTLAAPRRAQQFLPELCQKFTVATGWTLRVEPALEGPRQVRQRLERDPACIWHAPLTQGARTQAYLVLEGAAGEAAIESHDAIELAGVLAQLVNHLTRLTGRLRSRNREISTLVQLGLAVPAHDDLGYALSQLLKASAHLTGARGSAFFLLDPSTSQLRVRAVYQVQRETLPQQQRKLKSGSIDLLALSDQPVVVAQTDRAAGALLPEGMQSAMCAGVQSETAPFGTLWVYSRRPSHFTQRDCHVLQSIATQVAGVLERQALVRGSEVQERLTRDLKDASGFLGGVALQDLPRDPRFELAGRCTSCYEIGGDLCEVFPLSADCFALAVGDAAGNSIPAAMIMSAVRGALRTHPAECDEIPQLMRKLNVALCSITKPHQFMSLCYGVYDASQRVLTYTNAGHPVPILVRGGRVTTLESHGLLLGVVPEALYLSSSVDLQPGDLLVFYSDGITEARNRSEAMFRADGLAQTLAGLDGQPAAAVLEEVWNRVDQHALGGVAVDDRTLLVLKPT